MTDQEISRQITRYILGELNDEEEDQLWVEFLLDQQRFRQFETELNLYDLFQNKGFTLENADLKTEKPKRNLLWLYAAAAAVILFLSFNFFSTTYTGIDDLAVSQIELTELLGSDIYRDDQLVGSTIDYEINSAIASALAGNLDEAYQILDNLDMETLSVFEKQRVQYNQGIISYNKGDYKLSVTYFSELATIESVPDYMKDNTLWYKANAYLKLRDEDNATEALRKVIEMNAQNADNASILLNQLDVNNSQY